MKKVAYCNDEEIKKNINIMSITKKDCRNKQKISIENDLTNKKS